MKTTRVIFITLGWLLVCFQLLGYIGTLTSNDADLIEVNIPFLIGFNLPVILGLVLFFLAYRLKRKMKLLKEKEEIDSLLSNVDDR